MCVATDARAYDVLCVATELVMMTPVLMTMTPELMMMTPVLMMTPELMMMTPELMTMTPELMMMTPPGLDDGSLHPLWSSRGFTQTFHFWKENKRSQSVPHHAYVTYVTLPWYSIITGV